MRCQVIDGIPRRWYRDKMTHAELATAIAVEAVEEAGCSEHLTRAVILLEQARDAVADHVDGLPATSGIKTE